MRNLRGMRPVKGGPTGPLRNPLLSSHSSKEHFIKSIKNVCLFFIVLLFYCFIYYFIVLMSLNEVCHIANRQGRALILHLL